MTTIKPVKRFYVLHTGGDHGTPWVLTLDPCDRMEADRKIAWQVQGGCKKSEYRICTWEPEQHAFYDGERWFHPDRGPFTEEAWAKFQASLPQS